MTERDLQKEWDELVAARNALFDLAQKLMNLQDNVLREAAKRGITIKNRYDDE